MGFRHLPEDPSNGEGGEGSVDGWLRLRLDSWTEDLPRNDWNDAFRKCLSERFIGKQFSYPKKGREGSLREGGGRTKGRTILSELFLHYSFPFFSLFFICIVHVLGAFDFMLSKNHSKTIGYSCFHFGSRTEEIKMLNRRDALPAHFAPTEAFDRCQGFLFRYPP